LTAIVGSVVAPDLLTMFSFVSSTFVMDFSLEAIERFFGLLTGLFVRLSDSFVVAVVVVVEVCSIFSVRMYLLLSLLLLESSESILMVFLTLRPTRGVGRKYSFDVFPGLSGIL
jgi:hypothetical protein